MGLLTNLILSLIHLFLIATDILLVFIIVRLLYYKRQWRWLVALDSAGRPLADWFTGYIQKAISHFSNKVYSQRTLLVIGVLTLMFARLFLVGFFSK